MEQANKTTSITDCLLVPDDLFIRTMTLVLVLVLVFLHAEGLVRLTDRKDEEQSVRGPRDERKQLGLVDAEDVMEFELLGQAELVNERRHDVWVVLCSVALAAMFAVGQTEDMSHREG